jgi:hypothetical protein
MSSRTPRSGEPGSNHIAAISLPEFNEWAPALTAGATGNVMPLISIYGPMHEWIEPDI